jgi:hypothetical protein
MVVELVVAMGYGGTAEDAARVVGKTGDEGIDGIIKADRLGFDRIYIQAKRSKPPAASASPRPCNRLSGRPRGDEPELQSHGQRRDELSRRSIHDYKEEINR